MINRTSNERTIRKIMTAAPIKIAPYLRVLSWLSSLLTEMLSVNVGPSCGNRDLREPNINSLQGIKGIEIDACSSVLSVWKPKPGEVRLVWNGANGAVVQVVALYAEYRFPEKSNGQPT